MKNLFSNLYQKQNQAPLFKRLFAYFIDWYIISILTILPINLIFSLTFQEKNFASSIANLPLPQALIAFFIGLFLSIGYLVYYPYKHNGQTLGKKLLRLQIVKTNQEPLDFKTLFIRNGIGLLIIEGTFYSCSIYLWEVVNILSTTSVSSIALTVLGVISIGSMAISLWNSKHCMLHDFISKTNVIAIQK